jgi:excisionase family DNA binding protein
MGAQEARRARGAGMESNTVDKPPTFQGRRKRANERILEQNDMGEVVPRLLCIESASKFLGISNHSLRHRIAEGAIPYVRLNGGRRILLDIRDLERLIEAWKVNGE